MSINRLSGYACFSLESGQTLEVKFCNGATELFAQLMGFTTINQINESLTCSIVDGEVKLTPAYLKALRVYVYAAASYVCRVEKKPITFNQWMPSEWFDELGVGVFLQAIELPELPTEPQTTGQKKEVSQTIRSFKANALARLNLLPSAYYDLTPAETSALLDGVEDREVLFLQGIREIASLIRNAHFEDPIPKEEYMPLPGDKGRSKSGLSSQYTDPEVAFAMLGSVMGGELTVTYHDKNTLPAKDFVKVFGETFRQAKGTMAAPNR